MDNLNFEPLLLVKHNSDERHRMWDRLAQHKSNCSFPYPSAADNGGEVWEYMETVETRFLWFGKRYLHCLRHRYHPATNGRIMIKIPADSAFSPDDSDNAYYHDFG